MNIISKRLIVFTVLVTQTSYAQSGDSETTSESSRPNIVFLLADDLRWDSLGHLNDFGTQTPNLDTLAAAGVRFTNSYNTTAICQASRANYMAGQYEFTTGTNFAHGGMDYTTWEKSYPHQLKQAGYFTGFAGKFGFSVSTPEGKKGGADTVRPSFDWWAGWMDQGKYEITDNPDATEWFNKYGDKKEHTTHALGLLGQDFIRTAVKSGKPFNLSVSFKAPHGPFALDERYTEVYRGQTFGRPENYGIDEGSPLQARSGRPFVKKGKEWLEDYDKTMYKYHTLVLGLDAAVGMILEELNRQGVADNTIIIFAADNGYFNGSKGMGGKLYAYEESSLTPTIVYDPRRDRGAFTSKFETSDALTGNIDIAPTILDYADVEPVRGMQGKSLTPVLEGSKEAIHDSLLLMQVWGTASAQSLAVVTPDYKYIYWFYGGINGFESTEEMFDLGQDPLERNNIAGDSAYESELDSMRQYYDAFLKEWAARGVNRSGYPKYVRLADRHKPFEKNDPAEIAGMFNGDKKKDTQKKAEKDNEEGR
jgi:arylsulfatase A-like enzyme